MDESVEIWYLFRENPSGISKDPWPPIQPMRGTDCPSCFDVDHIFSFFAAYSENWWYSDHFRGRWCPMSSSDDDQGWQWARTVILINELLARVALKHFRLRLLWKVKVLLSLLPSKAQKHVKKSLRYFTPQMEVCKNLFYRIRPQTECEWSCFGKMLSYCGWMVYHGD